MAELVLSLRERELGRFPILALRTTIGRDPSCDVVIDNAGVSRLHAAIEVVGDSFVLRDCDSQNGMTLNGEPCREGRLVDGDMIGVNKFLLRFSNEALEVPANLQAPPEEEQASRPKDVQRTMHLDASAAQALAESAKAQIARRRAELAGNAESLSPLPSLQPRPRPSIRWEEPEDSTPSRVLLLGGLAVALVLICSVLAVTL